MTAPVPPLEPGVHVGLSNEAYHGDDALGSSDLKILLRSPADWKWTRPDNPLWTPPKSDGARAEGLLLGAALHAWVLEGESVFWERYRVAAAPPSGLLATTEEIKDWLGRERWPAGHSKLKKTDWEELARGLGAPLFSDWKAVEDADPRVAVNPDWLPAIRLIDAQMKVEPKLKAVFGADALAEISVVWEENGVRRKARFDRHAPGVLMDLKSFSGWKRQDTLWALKGEVIAYNYHMQAGCYCEGALRLPGFVEDGRVFWHAPVPGLADGEVARRLRAIAAVPPKRWIWAFCKTLDAPSTYILRVPDIEADAAIEAGVKACRVALANYRAWTEKFGDGPWLAAFSVDTDDEAAFGFWPDRLIWDKQPLEPE